MYSYRSNIFFVSVCLIPLPSIFSEKKNYTLLKLLFINSLPMQLSSYVIILVVNVCQNIRENHATVINI